MKRTLLQVVALSSLLIVFFSFGVSQSVEDSRTYERPRPIPPQCCRPFKVEELESTDRNPILGGSVEPRSLPPNFFSPERYRLSLEKYRITAEKLRISGEITREEYLERIKWYKEGIEDYREKVKP